MKISLLSTYFFIQITFAITSSSNNITKAFVEKLGYVFNRGILFPSDAEFATGAVLANYACRNLCPDILIRPISVEEVSNAVKLSRELRLPLVVRGGGHGYTCQGTRSGGIMIETRALNSIQIDYNPRNASMTIGTGLTWGEVLKALASYKQKSHVDLVTVHGQCTSVGVAGFSLHGGVHFGGLSTLFGLGSDNILALTAVIANGSVVHLSSDQCLIDGVPLSSPSSIYPSTSTSCQELWRSFRGAGSSFGIATNLTIALHPRPLIHTALTILSIDSSDPEAAEAILSAYMNSFPDEVTLTFFGLDAYFKAYFFILKFAQFHTRVLWNDIYRLFSDNNHYMIHFIVEASWIESSPSSSLSFSMNHTNNETSFIGNQTNQNTTTMTSYEYLDHIHHILGQYYTTTKDGGISRDKVILRSWFPSHDFWSVTSYDLVWGGGHSYGGASIMVTKSREKIALINTFRRYVAHKNTSDPSQLKCSDSVTVIHRINPNLSTRHKSHSTSFHSDFSKMTLWIELDYGHFHRMQSSWEACSDFIDNSQRLLDSSIIESKDMTKTKQGWGEQLQSIKAKFSSPLLNNEKQEETISMEGMHYVNVPNLITSEWPEQHYGIQGYKTLVQLKNIWDPDNLFSHLQSISPSPPSTDADTVDRLRQCTVTNQITHTVNTSIDININNTSTCTLQQQQQQQQQYKSSHEILNQYAASEKGAICRTIYENALWSSSHILIIGIIVVIILILFTTFLYRFIS